MNRDTVRECLAQEHNTVTRPGLISGALQALINLQKLQARLWHLLDLLFFFTLIFSFLHISTKQGWKDKGTLRTVKLTQNKLAQGAHRTAWVIITEKPSNQMLTACRGVVAKRRSWGARGPPFAFVLPKDIWLMSSETPPPPQPPTLTAHPKNVTFSKHSVDVDKTIWY